jgi:isocitrate/isopropylmalate dehydrogenase
MMGTKERNFQPLSEEISLEDLVPEDNFYRRLQQKLDLSFVRELVEDRYAASGRPSVDPEVFFSAYNWSCSMRVSAAREN